MYSKQPTLNSFQNCRRQFLVCFSLASLKRHLLIESSPMLFFLCALCESFVSPPQADLVTQKNSAQKSLPINMKLQTCIQNNRL